VLNKRFKSRKQSQEEFRNMTEMDNWEVICDDGIWIELAQDFAPKL
jgi:hypothetical protein